MQLSFSLLVATILSLTQSVVSTPSSHDSDSTETQASPLNTQCADPRLAVPFLKAYNTALIDHFYTTDAAELGNASGYRPEGTLGYIFLVEQPSTVPLWRLYHPVVHNHFYTVYTNNRDDNMKNGYLLEGIAGYVYPDAVCGGAPVYRMYNGGNEDNFYTTSATERDNQVKLGYAFQFVDGYIFPVSV